MIKDVVAALIWEQNRFMICQRPAHKARGLLWEFVGGKVEENESMEDALIRECREELDITISVGDLFTEVVHEYPDIHITAAVSNISFNLPKRKLVNMAFTSLAMKAGLDSAIFDPCIKDLLGVVFATEALLGNDEYCMEYIDAYRDGLFGEVK